MLTGRRFRVEFTGEQAEFAEQIASTCRAVWNTGLEQRREYRRRGGWINYRQQAGELAEAKGEHGWLGEVPGHCLQQTLMDLDKACRAHGTFRGAVALQPAVAAVVPVPRGQQDDRRAAQPPPRQGQTAQAGLGAV